jgi:hypothetical protein
LTEPLGINKLDETAMRHTFTAAPTPGSADVAARGLIVILLGILPR